MFTVVRYETHKLASGFLIAGFSALLYSKSENKSIVKRKQRTATSKLRNWKKIQISCTHSLHGNVRFLCVTACRSNAPRVLDIVEVSVCPSVRPSHPGTVSKRRHLESRNLHCGLSQVTKFRALG